MKARTRRVGTLVLPLALAALVVAGAAWAVAPTVSDQHEVRNYDARVQHNRTFRADPQSFQIQAVDALAATVPELAATYDPVTGVTRALSNQTGYLTGPNPGADPLDLARDFAYQHAGLLGLSTVDLDYEVTDNVYNRVTGATHVYLRQLYAGIPLYNGQLHVNVNRDGRVISINNAFLPGLGTSIQGMSPLLDARAAIVAAAQHLGIDGANPIPLSRPEGPRQTSRLRATGVSTEEIEAGLMWLPIRAGDARLVWNFQIVTRDGQHWYDLTVDAASGQVWTRFDWTNSDSYRVYPQPVESPNHTSPLPPSDGRVLVSNPADPTASPLGWHDTGSTSFTIMRGNNVHAYQDTDANNQPPASQPSCGAALNCDFSINLNQAPSQYQSAAIANLFYWNNIIHDVQYQYGFDEPGGNFQVNTFGNGGAGNDDVRAEAQDGSGTNNANFSTPTDGGRARMQMYIWTAPNPDKDGDIDNGIIIHEYGHGISVRQVGGPNNSSCLNNNQQGGEGWSDFHALVYTAEVGDQGTDGRGIGTYALNQPTTGVGIRTQRYSTNQSINNWTYESIQGMAIPHGVGSVWAQAIWEVYWALVDQYGFDPDLYDALGGAGNQRAQLYVNEGFKNTACSPTFTQARDGIIQAAVDNFGGADVCLLWEAFAAYGLGTDAVSGGSNSTNPTNGFSIPASCQCQPNPIADAGPDRTICLGDSTTIGTPAQAGHSYSWSPGGATTAQVTVSPSTTTTYTVTATTACGSAQDSVTVFVDTGTGGGGLDEDFESGASGWSASGLWHLAANSSCASPQPGFSSPVTAFYYGQNSTCTYNTGAANSGTLTSPVISGINSSSTLTFDYLREVESFNGSFDQTEVDILHSGGTDTVFALDSGDPSSAVWTSSPTISLAPYAGDSIQVRFTFNTVDNVANDQIGWFVDDVVVTAESSCQPSNTPPTVTITAPPDPTTVSEGTSVNFTGTATDAEDGNISGSISWSSNLDGSLGTGASVSATLSVGTHTVTASVTDSGGLSDSDNVTVIVEATPNTAPVVTITAPNDPTTVDEGTSVTFSGTATDAEDGNLTASLSWSSNLDGTIGSGGTFSTSSLSVGTHTVTASVTDSGGLSGFDTVTVIVNQVGGGCSDCIDWSVTPTESYGGQDVSQNVTVEDGGDTIFLQQNTWRRTTSADTFNITADTVLEFEFASSSEGEIHGIGFDEDNNISNATRVFQLYGTQNWASSNHDFDNYPGGGGFVSYSIPVGQYYTGSGLRMVLVNDKDAGALTNNSRFRNVRVFEDVPVGCTVDDDFEGGTAGWVNAAGSTCTTGAYVVGAPTLQSNGGVTTQVGGDHTPGSGVNAIFTAFNTGGAGTDDVDNGVCILESPVFSVSEASDLTIWYFHGQRDNGNNDADDFFRLEVSTNGGASYTSVVSIGDDTSQAAWTLASTSIPAGSSVRIRVQASDGPASGDLVEAGIDDLRICPSN